MWHVAVVIASFAAQGDNLLLNPGFEVLDGDMPARWSVFVMPMKGAEGGLDNAVTHSGAHCVRLFTPQPYPQEPMNNWSQNILVDLAGADLTLTGFVRTKEASEAALLLQCFRGDPYTLITAKSSNAEFPMFGDMDWKRVEVHLKVPLETKYVVVRCMLKGRGTAWFDDLTLVRASEAKPAPVGSETASASEKPAATTFEAKAKNSAPPASIAPEKLKDLVAANDELRKVAAEMRAMNESLSLQVKQLQVEIQMLRNSMIHSLQSGDEELSPLQLSPPPLAKQNFGPSRTR